MTRYGIFVRRSARKAFRARPADDETRMVVKACMQAGGFPTEDAARAVLAQFSAEARAMLEVSEFTYAGAFA